MQKNVAQNNMELVRLTTAGSVDDGKSTLIGRLLYECGAIYHDQLAAVENASKKRGREEIDLSLLLDGLAAEREQGITIDVAYRYFSTARRKFIIADTPGHEQYTRNMVTGASTANVALILADARKGLLIQSKRHLFVASLLGIPHILVVVNKMDLVGYDEAVFNKIKEEFADFAAKMEIGDLQFVPISALRGDMVVERNGVMDWYQGPTLMSYLDNLQIQSDRNLIDFRFPVQHVIRPHQDFRGYAGKVEGGSVRVGENVVILPSGKKTKVESIIFDDAEQELAFNPQSVVLTLEDERDVSRGDMIVRENNLPKVGKEFEATLCWFSEEKMEVGKRYLLKHTTKVTPFVFEELRYRVNVDTLAREKSGDLGLNEIGRVKVHANQDLAFDVYSKNRNTGSFIVIDAMTNDTVGVGMIISKGKVAAEEREAGEVVASFSTEQQKGAVLWFTGLSGAGKSTIADALYERLKNEGVRCERLDGDVLRESLCADLGFSEEDRWLNVERVAFVAEMLAKHGVVVLASFISPFKDQRDKLKERGFVEVFVDTDLAVCEERDVKGLYAKARAGEIKNFTGVSAEYEVPENPDLRVNGAGDVEEQVEKLMKYLKDSL